MLEKSKRQLVQLKRNWDGLSNGWQQGLFAAAIAVLIALISLGGWWAAVSTVFVMVIVLYVLLMLRTNALDEHAPSYQELTKRLGTSLSIHSEPEHFDNRHEYEHFERVDLLDFMKGDFFSIRRIQGKNVSGDDSAFVPYVEHSEKKCTFFECRVRAYDFKTKQELHVEKMGSDSSKEFAIPFRIFFPAPIKDGGEFDIVYCITLPGELDQLDDKDEDMSVYLGRVKNGVKKLVFKVCINFKPKTTFVECFDSNSNPATVDGTLEFPKEFEVSNWAERQFDREWSSKPYAMVFTSESPASMLYKIFFKR